MERSSASRTSQMLTMLVSIAIAGIIVGLLVGFGANANRQGPQATMGTLKTVAGQVEGWRHVNGALMVDFADGSGVQLRDPVQEIRTGEWNVLIYDDGGQLVGVTADIEAARRFATARRAQLQASDEFFNRE